MCPFLKYKADWITEGTIYKDEPMQPKWWVGLTDYSDKHIKEKGLHEAECQRDLDGGPGYVERTSLQSQLWLISFHPNELHTAYIFSALYQLCVRRHIYAPISPNQTTRTHATKSDIYLEAWRCVQIQLYIMYTTSSFISLCTIWLCMQKT